MPTIIQQNAVHGKIRDENNSSYVDSFFSYLTSQLLHKGVFSHGLDFYGSYLGIKNKYHVDIGDDIDMLNASDFFHKNKQLYEFINKDHENIFNDQSRSNKKPIVVGNNIEDSSILNLEDLENIEILDSQLFLIENKDENENKNENENLLYENKNINIRKSKTESESNSDISSRSSKTDNDDDDDNNSNEDNSTYSDNSDSSDDSESDVVMVSIEKFPIQIISLECCENTFDYLLANDKLNDDELTCIIIQILMMLITYQN